MVLLTAAAVMTKYLCQYVFHLKEAYDFYIFPRPFLFDDYGCFGMRFKDFHHATFFSNDAAHSMVFTYPSPVALAYEIFYGVHHGLTVYLLTCIFLVTVIAYTFAKALERHGLSRWTSLIFVSVCVVTSYPLFFNFWVGNMEIFQCVLLSLGLYFFLNEKMWAAATFLGLAGSMKIYPLVFLVLLLARKQYRQIVYAIAVFVVANIVGLELMSGSVTRSWYGVQAGLAFYTTHYALAFNTLDMGMDHSLFAEIKEGILLFGFAPPQQATMAAIMRVFLATSAVAMLLLYFGRVRKLPMLNQVLCLSTMLLLFSPGSKEFTSMNLYVPWGMMVLLAIEAWRHDRVIPGMNAAMACFTLLFVALNDFIAHGNVLNGEIKGIVLFALLWVGLHYPFVGTEQPSVYAPA